MRRREFLRVGRGRVPDHFAASSKDTARSAREDRRFWRYVLPQERLRLVFLDKVLDTRKFCNTRKIDRLSEIMPSLDGTREVHDIKTSSSISAGIF